MLPSHLFRVFSPHSGGINSAAGFVPVSNGDVSSVPTTSLGSLLQASLRGDRDPEIPFIYFTTSLLFEIQYANWKASRGDQDIQIVCIDTFTAKTPSGDCAVFHSIPSLAKTYGIETKYAGDTEFVTIGGVVPGPGSSIVTLEKLISTGLFRLYPELEEVNKRRDFKWYSTIGRLRDYSFAAVQPLCHEKIDMATKLAACFSPTTGANRWVSNFLLASFLALRKRDINDLSLVKWLGSHGVLLVDEFEAAKLSEAEPEVGQCKEMLDLISGLRVATASLKSNINLSTTESERRQYTSWQRPRRDQSGGQMRPRKPTGTLGTRPALDRNYKRTRHERKHEVRSVRQGVSKVYKRKSEKH